MRILKIVTNPNPVGTPSYELLVNEVRQYVDQWAIAQSQSKQGWRAAVGYIIDAVDDFIISIDNQLASGADKKATVMAALMVLYNAIVPTLLPIYLKPFASQFRIFVFDIVISTLIDVFVSKYRTGNWVPPVATPIPVVTT